MNRRFGLAPLIGLVLASVLTLSGCYNPFGPAGFGDVDLTPGQQEILTVDPSALLPDGVSCQSNAFLDHALRPVEKGNAEARDNTHAPSIPMKATDNKEAALAEVMAEHCGNPTELYMTLKALSTWEFGEWKLVEHNKWIADFLGAAESKGLRKTTLSYKSKDSKDIIVTVDYQKTAAMANTLLLRAQNAGFVAAPSVTNWIVKGDDTVGELPLSVPNSEQEGLTALRMEFTEKDTGCFAAFGYNKLDKRFETFKCKEEVAPAPSGTTAPAPAGTTAPTGGDQPTGTSTTTPSGGGSDCVEIQGNGIVDCGGDKVPARDPANQGNVPEQVIGGNPATAPSASAAAVPEPAAPYVAPAPPEPAAAASPTPVPRTTEPSPAATGANTPEPGKPGCVFAPGETSC